MRILLYTQYFPPETNAPANRWSYFCEYLAQKGYQIYVLTTFPIEFQKFFKNLKVREDNYQNLKIIRVARPIFHWNNCFTHWISDLIFSFLSYKNSVNIPDVDLMIVIAPPYYYLGNAFKIARRRRTPLVVDLNELSLETNIRSLSQFNFKNWFLQRQLNKIFEKVFAFITPTKALKNYLVFKFGISLNKVFYLPNGADIKFFTEKVDSSFIIRQYNLYDDFIVSYTGILSEDQNPCILIETALLLKENKQIKFLIVGGGPLEEKLKIKAKELKLNNIIFIGLVPHSEINKYINLSDVC
ncbi:MAG: glycosyltransferase family 4 protein, partial [Minisyncoccia bacterium]